MAAAGAFLVTVSCAIRGYHVYRGVELQYWRRDRVLRRGRELPSQENCNLTSNDISKRNIASELSSGASTVVKHCSRGVYSH